jgi:CelD/BcsL family acetyltransferase involved in cellulose biosynthesis
MIVPASGLDSALINDPADVAEIEDEWRALAELRGSAFLTPEWFRSWWDHRPAATSALITTARREDGSLAGVMPLVFDFARRPRMIRFAGASFGDRFAPAAQEAEEGAVAAASLAVLARAGLDRYPLVLNHVELGSPWWRELRQASATERAGIVQQRSEQPYIRFDGLDWEGYLASRSSSFRKKIRQRERKLQREHQVEVRSATPQTLQTDLDHFFTLHDRRWQGRSSLDAPGAKQFLSAFAGAAAQRGWLRLRLLEVDGTPVAALLGWRIGDRYAFYNSGFDPAWSELSVGMVLLTRTIESAFEEGASEFDMLLGDEDYKRRFQNASRDVHTVVLTKSMAPARLLITAEAGARRWGRRLAERRALNGTAHTLRRLLPTSRSF